MPSAQQARLKKTSLSKSEVDARRNENERLKLRIKDLEILASKSSQCLSQLPEEPANDDLLSFTDFLNFGTRTDGSSEAHKSIEFPSRASKRNPTIPSKATMGDFDDIRRALPEKLPTSLKSSGSKTSSTAKSNSSHESWKFANVTGMPQSDSDEVQQRTRRELETQTIDGDRLFAV